MWEIVFPTIGKKWLNPGESRMLEESIMKLQILLWVNVLLLLPLPHWVSFSGAPLLVKGKEVTFCHQPVIWLHPLPSHFRTQVHYLFPSVLCGRIKCKHSSFCELTFSDSLWSASAGHPRLFMVFKRKRERAVWPRLKGAPCPSLSLSLLSCVLSATTCSPSQCAQIITGLRQSIVPSLCCKANILFSEYKTVENQDLTKAEQSISI